MYLNTRQKRGLEDIAVEYEQTCVECGSQNLEAVDGSWVTGNALDAHYECRGCGKANGLFVPADKVEALGLIQTYSDTPETS